MQSGDKDRLEKQPLSRKKDIYSSLSKILGSTPSPQSTKQLKQHSQQYNGQSQSQYFRDELSTISSEQLELSTEATRNKSSFESFSHKKISVKHNKSAQQTPQTFKQKGYLQLSVQLSPASSAGISSPPKNKFQQHEQLPQILSNSQLIKTSKGNNMSGKQIMKKTESRLFFEAISPQPFEIKKLPPQRIYTQIAPLTALYNNSKIMESHNQNLVEPSASLLPRAYLKYRKLDVEISCGTQSAYKIIKDIDSEKKFFLHKLALIEKQQIEAAKIFNDTHLCNNFI